jgi:anti-sigma regulatory factor (Ser/Thr protein kinase)
MSHDGHRSRAAKSTPPAHHAGDTPDHHGMFVYDNDDDFVDRLTSYLGPGTDSGEVGIAILTPEKWALLCEGLGDASQRIEYLERDAVYVRPLETLAAYDAALREAVADGAPAVRLIGEFPVMKSQRECEEWTLYDALVNRVFAGRQISLLCGYDVREQSAAGLEAAWRTHPRALVEGWEDNPRYQDPAHVVKGLTRHPESLAEMRELPVEADPRAFAARLRRELASLRVPEATAEKLLLAAAEVFENARTHGHGARSQRIGCVAGVVVWELTDNGPGFDDPLAGYLPPGNGGAKGRGLWIVRELTRDVEFLPSPVGFTVRLWV